jgi:hypothetical protein
MAKKKPTRKKKSPANKKKPVRKAKVVAKRKKPAKAKRSTRRTGPGRRTRGSSRSSAPTAQIRQGVGLPGTGGQSGDIQGLSNTEDVDSESVRELAEEGQDYEAGIVDGIENAPDPDVSEVKTREVPEDDVPDEYKNQD